MKLAWSPNGKLIASGFRWIRRSSYGTPQRRTERSTLTGPTSLVHGLAFSGDGKSLAVASSTDNTVRLWELASRRALKDAGAWTLGLAAMEVGAIIPHKTRWRPFP